MLNTSIRAIVIIGLFAVVFIAGIGFLIVDWKQAVCQPGAYIFGWFGFKGFQREYCAVSTPPNPPFMGFNYAKYTMTLSDANNFVEPLKGMDDFSQAVSSDSRLSWCTYTADASSGIRLVVTGAPPEGGYTLQLQVPNFPPSQPCSSQGTPLQLNDLSETPQRDPNGKWKAHVNMTFQIPQSNGQTTPKTLDSSPNGVAHLNVTQWDLTNPGIVAGNFEAVLRDDTDPNAVIVVVVTRSSLVATHQ